LNGSRLNPKTDKRPDPGPTSVRTRRSWATWSTTSTSTRLHGPRSCSRQIPHGLAEHPGLLQRVGPCVGCTATPRAPEDLQTDQSDAETHFDWPSLAIPQTCSRREMTDGVGASERNPGAQARSAFLVRNRANGSQIVPEAEPSFIVICVTTGTTSPGSALPGPVAHARRGGTALGPVGRTLGTDLLGGRRPVAGVISAVVALALGALCAWFSAAAPAPGATRSATRT